ncbi:MAG: hypothetical protein WC379_14310 [Methanoregula sp.]|jgi:hypothetical protein
MCYENRIMVENRTCAQCGKKAIGFQSIGCGFMDVCEDHADSHILALKPGEKQSVGDSCFFERFSTTDS